MIVFSNTFRFLFVFFLCFAFIIPVAAQNTADTLVNKRIQEGYNDYKNNQTKERYIKRHSILKEAIKSGDLRLELAVYTNLFQDHGNDYVIERNFDSVLYYFDKFESRLARIDTSKQQHKALYGVVANYYYRKGSVLYNCFGLLEPGMMSVYKATPYCDKNNVNSLVLHDIRLSKIYKKKKQYDKVIELLNPHLKDTAVLSDVVKRSLFLTMGMTHRFKKMPEQSFYYNNKALAVWEKSKNEMAFWFVKNEISYDYFLFGDAQKAIDSALAVRKYYRASNNKYKALINNNLGYLSAFYYAVGNIDKAIMYANEKLNLNASAFAVSIAYDELVQYAIKKNDYKSVIKYYKKKDKITDSIRIVEKAMFIKYSDANMKLMKEEHIHKNVLYENQLLEEKNRKQKLYLLIISVLFILAAIILGLLYLFNKYKKSKKDVVVLKTNEKLLLEEQIRLRDHELDVSVIAISQRVATLHTIKEELEAIKDYNPKLQRVNDTIKGLIASASGLYVVTDKIESQYPTVITELKLKHPKLSETDIRYCLLTKLSLSIKETAMMLNVTPNTVKVTRSKIKKKMEIPKELSLKAYLDEIFRETVAFT